MTLKEKAIAELKECLDPELGLDVWTLGFVRKLEIDARVKSASVIMTLTSPLCPHGRTMTGEIERRLKKLGLKKISIQMSFDPPWKPPAEVRQILGL